MRYTEEHNRATEEGRHDEGASLGVRTGRVGRRERPTRGQSPTTGAEHEFNGLHPERVKELKNAGEEQAEDQVSEQASPFNGSLAELEAPEEAGEDELGTMPDDNPPAGLEHEAEPHEGRIPPKRLGAVTGPGHYAPHADAHSGGMHVKARRAGAPSAFYGD